METQPRRTRFDLEVKRFPAYVARMSTNRGKLEPHGIKSVADGLFNWLNGKKYFVKSRFVFRIVERSRSREKTDQRVQGELRREEERG